MKIRVLIGIILLFYLNFRGFSQHVRIPVNNPSTGKVVLNNLQGAVIVDGYDGTELIISVDSFSFYRQNIKGLTPVYNSVYDNTGVGLLIEEINRIIEISGTLPQSSGIQYKLLIPQNLDVKIDYNSIEGKDIILNDLNREIEVESKENDINLDNIKGPIVVNNMSGNIKISFSDLNQDYPTSISTISGNIDITLPQKTNANLILKSMTGEIFTNFELQIDTYQGGFSPTPYGGKTIYAKINKGGVDVVIETVNGNIFLRKSDKK